jgi:hypothetical protein
VDAFDDVERELGRVVDRLTSMPLAKAALATEDCHRAAEVVVAQTRLLSDDIPADSQVPDLGPQGLGAMIAVLGGDYLDAARASGSGPVDPGPVLDALVSLRRALP